MRSSGKSPHGGAELRSGPKAPYVPVWAQPPKKGRPGRWIAVTVLAVVIAAAASLVFTVFKDAVFTPGPEETVRDLLTALEDKDFEALFELYEPGAQVAALRGTTLEELAEATADTVFDYDSLRFLEVELEAEQEGDRAKVNATAGRTATLVDGKMVIAEIGASDELGSFELVRIDGRWYLSDASPF